MPVKSWNRRSRAALCAAALVVAVAMPVVVATPASAAVTGGFTPGQPTIDPVLDYNFGPFGSGTYHMQMSLISVRGPNFEVYTQAADGTLTRVDPATIAPPATYIGTADEDLGSLASGVVMPDGHVEGDLFLNRGQRVFEFADGDLVGAFRGDLYDQAAQQPTWHWPSSADATNNVTVAPGQIAANPLAYEQAVDVTADWFHHADAGNSSVATTLAKIEANLAMATAMYGSQLNYRPLLGRVVIRTDEAASPYLSTDDGNTTLAKARDAWNTPALDVGWSDVYVMDGDCSPEGIAYLGGFANDNGVALSCAYSRAGTLYRHEVGHNLDALDDTSGFPEGTTVYGPVMKNIGRFDGTEVARMMRHKNGTVVSTGRGIEPAPPLTIPLPPYAALDLIDAVGGTTVDLPVVANDFDVNTQGTGGVALTRVDAASALGGTLSIVGGQVRYTPPAVAADDTLDSFTYTVTDANGLTGTGVVLLHVDPAAAAPATIELSAPASSPENVGGALPVILVNGVVTAATTVTVTLTGTATAGADYTGATQTVTIPAGTYDGTAATAVAIPGVTVTGDTEVEPDETIDYALSAPTGDGVLGDANSDGTTRTTTTYTIANDDSVVVELSPASGSAAENASGSLPAVRVRGEVLVPFTVQVTFSGTATRGADYAAAASPLTVTIPAGTYDGVSAASLIAIPGLSVTDDALSEGDETIIASLSAPTGGATLGDADSDAATTLSAVHTIVDDEAPVVVDPDEPAGPATPADPTGAGLAATGADLAAAARVAALLLAVGAALLFFRGRTRMSTVD